MATFEELHRKLERPNRVDFGDTLTYCIDLFKKVWLKGFVVVLIAAAVGFVLGFLFEMIGLGSTNYFNFDTGLSVEFDFFSFYAMNSLYSLPQSILMNALSIGILAGFYRMCKIENEEGGKNDEFFYFFQQGYTTKIFMLGLINAVISTLATLVFVLPSIYVAIPLMFFSVIFANNPELSETEIVKLSFNLGTKKWFVTFGLVFVCFLMALLGLVACFIGILFTMSIIWLPVYFVYRDVIGFDNFNEIEQIGTNSWGD